MKSKNFLIPDGIEYYLGEDAVKFDLTKDQRGYGLTDNIMEIKSVDYDGKLIKKLIGRPEVRDLS